MQRTASDFLSNEMKEMEAAKPGAKILSFDGVQSHDSIPASPKVGVTDQYDLICVDALVHKLRTSEKAQELMATLFSGLGPGGRLLVGGEREHFPEDTPDTQDLEDMATLGSRIPEHEVSGQAVFRDPSGRSVFFEIYKVA
jgi:hypothetical protein